MPVLATPNQVIVRTGVREIPSYVNAQPMSDCAGFFVHRPYPPESDLAQVLNRQGEQLLSCIIQFIVDPPTARAGVCRVYLRAWLHDRSGLLRRRFPHTEDTDLSHPDAPTPDSLHRFRQARKPLPLDFRDDFLYDVAADEFTNDDGTRVTPARLLDHAYQAHCATMQRRFVWRWQIGSFFRWLARNAVWRGQDVLLWLLLHLYDVELALKEEELLHPFHVFKYSEFRRVSEKPGERSQFFGFPSSRKNLFTNLVIISVACILLYYLGSRGGIIEAIYRNTALTTAALVMGFLVADLLGPWLLMTGVCALSRLREAVMFIIRKVRT